eukprot:TRINITY_DN3725_c0_g1_i1.p1 TRINITY_DN3725_c0_g1~~TRINITY_DN3725_c0_g1_i1.p1  ORF type:complete len:247 (+),score=29.43 TRINITY_DN3725_c0_g1_i1:16-756(+)
MSITDPVLFVGWFCPFAQRTWIGFEYLNVKHTLVNGEDSVVLDSENKLMLKGKRLVDATPAGQVAVVPTVIWGEGQDKKTKTGSIDLLLACKDNSDPFFRGKETLDEWGKLCGSDFYGSLKPDIHEECFARLSETLALFSERLDGPFYHGEEFSIVDCVVFPFLYRAFSLKLFQAFRNHDVHGFPWSSKLQSWVDRCLELPSVRKTLPDDADPATGFSQKLFNVYPIYAQGIGLKGVVAESIDEPQ